MLCTVQIKASATGRYLVQRTYTDCLSLSVFRCNNKPVHLQCVSRRCKTKQDKKCTYKSTATLEPDDKTQQTNIWLGVRRQTCVAIFNPICLPRRLPTKGIIFLRLLIVGDMNVTWRQRLMMTGNYICCWIATFAWSTRTEEDGGCISFGNQELMENIL